MVITTIGKSGTALILAGQGAAPNYIALGNGSGTELASLSGLYNEISGTRKELTTATSNNLRKVTWTGDWSSVEMSGLDLLEFGLFTGSAGNQLWHYVNLGNGINFDGSNELRVEITWEII